MMGTFAVLGIEGKPKPDESESESVPPEPVDFKRESD